MCVRMSMFLSFTKSQCAEFSTVKHSVCSDSAADTLASNTTQSPGAEWSYSTFYNTPGVETTSHPLAFSLHHCVAANYCKGNALLVGKTEGIVKMKVLFWYGINQA